MRLMGIRRKGILFFFSYRYIKRLVIGLMEYTSESLVFLNGIGTYNISSVTQDMISAVRFWENR